MQKTVRLIQTKLHQPYIRPEAVYRPLLEEKIVQGLRGPLTLIVAPAGFGKTTLVASCIPSLNMPVAWLSLDKDDNQPGRFLTYLIAAIRQVENTIGSEAEQILAASRHVLPEAVLTSLINDLDTAGEEIAMVFDDYHFISNKAVHSAVAFLLEHCPKTFHLLIATRSDPQLPLARLRSRGYMLELRATDLRFTMPEANQFLNEVMKLGLDTESVGMLEQRTEGWIAGLQMAALSMRDRNDIPGFIEGFSGTNRYIMDYLLEEVLASQPPEIQYFILCTSILERLTAPLCEAVLEIDRLEDIRLDGSDETYQTSKPRNCQPILEYLERVNLFLVPLDDKRRWFRYHHLFTDLLRSQLQKTFGGQEVMQLHLRAAAWHEQNGSIMEAIHHASMAANDEMVERLIQQNYLEMMNRGEMSWVSSWMGNLSKDLICQRPWLCLYEAMNRSWFGQLEEAKALLDEAEKRIRTKDSSPDTRSMLGYHAYVKSRVIAMQGDTPRAIEYCLTARENVPADNLELQIDFSITLGYEYFLNGDFFNANKILNETIQLGSIARAINNPVAAYCLLARSQIYQGRLHEANDLLHKAEQLIHQGSSQYLGVVGLLEVERAALWCEQNEVDTALAGIKQGLDHLPWWGKADDFCLAYITLARIHLALGDRIEAAGVIKEAAQLVMSCGVFSEARCAVEAAQVKMWLVQGDWPSVDRWAAEFGKRFDSPDPFRFEDELTHITQARVLMAQNKPDEAIRLLTCLEESARLGGRQGRLIEILNLKALAFQATGDVAQANLNLTESMVLAEPEEYVRIFLDEGQFMQYLLNQWLSHIESHPVRNYATHLLLQLENELPIHKSAQEKISMTSDLSASTGQDLIEPISPREREVLEIMALGRTNQEIAQQLTISPGTVKAHAASIYRKLDVANRTEAVARARQLGILS